jgi:hypothetical protein
LGAARTEVRFVDDPRSVIQPDSRVRESGVLKWQHSRDRAEADTNPDVRAEVQRQGYCLFAISASFDELDRDLRSSRLPGETVVRGSQALTLAVRETQP